MLTWEQLLYIVGYILAFLFCSIGLAFFWRHRRGTEIPFGQDMKLLRHAGESQFEVVRTFDEAFSEKVVLWGAMPAIPVLLMIMAMRGLPKTLHAPWLVLTALFFIGGLVFCLWRVAKGIQGRGDRYLGYMGERFIADCLEPLKQQRWHVVHDVPMEGKTSDFNIDHVVVGPRGLFVIETKTWRKRRWKRGDPIPQVTFDGVTLIGPRGVDNEPVEQVERNARDLEVTLKRETNLDVTAKPILTFPEWAVDFSQTGPDAKTHVVKSDKLVKFIANGRDDLDADVVTRIALALERRCRTVKY